MRLDRSSVPSVLPIAALRTSGSGQRTEPKSTKVQSREGLCDARRFDRLFQRSPLQRTTCAASALTTNGRTLSRRGQPCRLNRVKHRMHSGVRQKENHDGTQAPHHSSHDGGSRRPLLHFDRCVGARRRKSRRRRSRRIRGRIRRRIPQWRLWSFRIPSRRLRAVWWLWIWLWLPLRVLLRLPLLLLLLKPTVMNLDAARRGFAA
jgi:hypothetical protein